MTKVLITGGLGYRGSHLVCKLVKKGYFVVITDYSYSIEPFHQILKAIGKENENKVFLYNIDIRSEKIRSVFSENEISCVIHFARIKTIPESFLFPIECYENNFYGTLNILKVMREFEVFNFIFGSSYEAYFDNKNTSFEKSLEFTEKMMEDICFSDKRWNIFSIRNFQLCGMKKEFSFEREDPFRILSEVAYSNTIEKKNENYNISGNDYSESHDGTLVRDFMHISDFSRGYLYILKNILQGEQSVENFQKNKVNYYDICSSKPISYLELVNVFIFVNSQTYHISLPIKFQERKENDICLIISKENRMYEDFGFRPKKTIENMCKESWESTILSHKS